MTNFLSFFSLEKWIWPRQRVLRKSLSESARHPMTFSCDFTCSSEINWSAEWLLQASGKIFCNTDHREAAKRVPCSTKPHVLLLASGHLSHQQLGSQHWPAALFPLGMPFTETVLHCWLLPSWNWDPKLKKCTVLTLDSCFISTCYLSYCSCILVIQACSPRFQLA